ncbi:DUF1926 domain-containing protein [bacterium]|nr:DUF1926 domain-containing protein [bacterium]
MKRINFAFGVHLHQPLGNFDHVFEFALEKSYRPFMETLWRFERVKTAVHVTGTLWEWIEAHHPEFFDLMRKLQDRGQIEVLGGGFYEPILSVIPEWDRKAQIALMNRRIKKMFGKKPKGMWTAERVWEPQLASIIARGGIEYVVLDDYHFKAAGLLSSELFGYFVTEDAGERLAVFPISERLRYLIPFAKPQEPIDYLREMASDDGERLLVMIDDCEKFGVWPGTHKWVFKEKWLEKFLKLLSEADFINFVTPSEFKNSSKPSGRVYLPTCSYHEMGEWSLPTESALVYESLLAQLKEDDSLERYKPFVRGGFWRGFLAKYPESNYMHKRMCSVSKMVHGAKVPASVRKLAATNVMRAQCNCAYWHGIFGGLYFPHLRFAIYRELIEAESLIQSSLLGKKKWVSLSQDDIDADGVDEVLIGNPNLGCVLSRTGGAMVELDCRRSKTNLLDSLSRHKEAYHAHLRASDDEADTDEHASIHDRQFTTSERMMKRLNYDWHRKWSFVDHFLAAGTKLADVRDAKYRDLGDFVKARFDLKTSESGSVASAEFARCGHLYFDEGRRSLELKKRFSVEAAGSSVCCDYEIRNADGESIEAVFGVEFSIACYGDKEHCSFSRGDDVWEPLADTASLERVSAVRLADPYRGYTVKLEWDGEAGVFRFPLETVSQSEKGFDLIKQATTVVVLWPLNLAGGASLKRSVLLDLSPL